MKISEKLLRVHAAVVVDKAKNGGVGMLGDIIGKAAVRAITKGPRSDEWRAYMSLFADSVAQLDRLAPEDPESGDEWLKESRAYIVANAVCAAGTNTATPNGVRMSTIDDPADSTDEADEVRNLRPVQIENPF